MESKKAARQDGSRGPKSTSKRATERACDISGQPRVPGRWLMTAVALAIAAAVLCTWSALCLLFWQGSWQLLYHPAARVVRTPADAGLAFGSVEFAASDAGVPQLNGWWIPAAEDAKYRRFTFVYLHGQDGNLGGTVETLARLHALGVNVLAFDYRGYGKSQFARPSEAHWREDAESALRYLIQTRHVNPAAIVLDGAGLGANLALEVAAKHASLDGVVLDSPDGAPMDAVFNDPRARLVPARLLNRDRYDLIGSATDLRIPSLWIMRTAPAEKGGESIEPAAYQKVSSSKMLVWLNGAGNGKQYADALSRWLDGLQVR